MQTFLTSTKLRCFEQTAEELDNKRLNKQALEAWQIMMTNLKLDPEGNAREPKGWYNHPAVKMWRGHEGLLLDYIRAMADEWVKRGYKTTIYNKAQATYSTAVVKGLTAMTTYKQPTWMENFVTFTSLTSSHRLALLVKNYEWYSQFGWDEDPGKQPDGYDYVWGDNANQQ